MAGERVAMPPSTAPSVVAQIAELQHNLERLDGKRVSYSRTFGVAGGAPAS